MKSLVLGGNGFIGSHVVDALIASGESVRVFDRGPELYRPRIAGVDYRIDSLSNFSSLAEALEGVDVVYHLISTTVPSTSNLDPLGDIDGNLVNTVKLIQLMVQKNCKRIVYLSSGGTVYGVPRSIPISEDHPLNPLCSYGVVKVAIENYLFMFHHLYGLEPVVLRASNPYGERQTHSGVQGVIGTFFEKTLRGDPIEIWGDGGVIRDFIYVKDLAILAVTAARSDYVGIINAGSGKGSSIKEVLHAIGDVVGDDIPHVFKASRAFDVPQVVLDISKSFDLFGWTPKTRFIDGLQATWQWMRSL